MREIKFRVWDNTEKVFLEGWRTAQLVIRPLSGRVTDGATTPDVTLMQYTGLKDKNDKEIYEGDIESDENGNLSVVCYLEKYGAYCFVPLVLYVNEDYENQVEYGYGYDCYFHNAIPSKYSTVIGNIYENPELLEESQNGTK